MTVRRGSVVARAGSHFVVWTVVPPRRPGDDRRFMVFRLVDDPPRRAGDVSIAAEERLAAGIPDQVVIRTASLLHVRAEGHDHVGELPGPLACRLVQAVARLANERGIVDRWNADRALRGELTQCVKIVG